MKLNPMPIISVAPMMDWTDRHERYFLRLIARDVQLYTEMITTEALLHGNAKRFLSHDPFEKYVALQLGGSEPSKLSACATMGEEAGFDEINLNVGCPSDRVKSGQFGACLMLQPQLVADCVAAMSAKVNIPVTVKCRIGVDQQDDYADLLQFIKLNAEAGCKTFIVHARKAWLSGLSPKQNRTVPPLRYEIVHQIKKDFPQLTIIINGGIQSISDIEKQLPFVDGVMIGRAAYQHPLLLAEIQQQFFSSEKISPRKVLENFFPYVEQQLSEGVRLASITKHLLGLFQGVYGANRWRRYLSENAHKKGAGIEVIQNALTAMQI